MDSAQNRNLAKKNHICAKVNYILRLSYSRVQENFVFRPEMAIFRRTGMREGGLLQPLAFQCLILPIFMI